MVNVDEALRVIAEKTSPVVPRRVGILEDWQGGGTGRGALGGVLAEAVRMAEESPRFDRAVVDGFALRSDDAQAGVELELLGHVDAGGAAFGGTIGRGQCVAINTGGVVPTGADAVLMVEQSERVFREGREFVRVLRAVVPEGGIQRKGSEAVAGSVVLEAGARLGAGQLGACAAAGVGSVLMRRMVAGVMTTGDELVDPGAAAGSGALAPGKIWNSNRALLCGLAQVAGGEVRDLGNCPDEAAVMERRLAEGLDRCDLLMVCGGMSMGSKDLAPGLLKGLGVEMHIEKVRMKPGKPFLFGTVMRGGRRKYVAGLPGNPVSAFVTFQRFVREVMGRMIGAAETGPRVIVAEAAGDFPANGDREFYQPCRLGQREGRPAVTAELLSWKGSGNALMLAQTQGLVIRQAGAAAAKAGETVRVLLVNGV